MKRIWILFILFLALVGCSKTPKAIIEVESNPSTGYSWQLKQSKSLFEVEEKFDQPKSSQVGKSGIMRYRLIPKEEGTTEIKLSYQREWEEENLIEYIYRFTVSSDLTVEYEFISSNMTNSEIEAMGLSYPNIEME